MNRSCVTRAGVAKPGLRRQTQDLFLQRFGGSNPFPCTLLFLIGVKKKSIRPLKSELINVDTDFHIFLSDFYFLGVVTEESFKKCFDEPY